MILKVFAYLFKNLVDSLFAGFTIVHLPVQLIATIGTAGAVGTWIIGEDLVTTAFTCIVFWIGVKVVIGLVLFIYKLLPFT